MFSPFCNISHYFGVWCPTDFIALRLKALWLKIKTYLIWFQQRLVRQEIACAWGLEKKLVICCDLHFVLPFSVCLWEDEVTMQVLWRQKELWKRKILGHRMMHEKAIWKPGKDKDNATRRAGDGGLQRPIWAPSCKTHIELWPTSTELWPTSIKLNSLWKTEVSKSAWIKPCFDNKIFYFHESLGKDIIISIKMNNTNCEKHSSIS